MDEHIKENLVHIRRKIAEAEKAADRAPASVKLLAVSKTFSVKDILAAYSCGQRIFGENRIQEIEKKAPELPRGIEWHLIGHLQSNKVLKAVEFVDFIHSVDSEKLIARIDKIAKEKHKKPKILIEVNISGESSKFGVPLEKVESCVVAALKCSSLELAGFMTMAPYNANEEVVNHIFSALRNERDRLERKLAVALPELSMGMSSDYKTAIANGATIVRIGTAIFGSRAYEQNEGRSE